jgi:serine/threonine protein kinase
MNLEDLVDDDQVGDE